MFAGQLTRVTSLHLRQVAPYGTTPTERSRLTQRLSSRADHLRESAR